MTHDYNVQLHKKVKQQRLWTDPQKERKIKFITKKSLTLKYTFILLQKLVLLNNFTCRFSCLEIYD